MKTSLCSVMTALAASSLIAVTVPNPSFEESSGKGLKHWKSTSSEFCQVTDRTAADGRQSLRISGNGKNNHYWLSGPVGFRRGGIYRISYQAKCLPKTLGTLISGPLFANTDTKLTNEEWQSFSSIFYVPDNLSAGSDKIRFGEWRADGTFFVDDVQVTELQPIYHQDGGMTLGEGEKVTINAYKFTAPYTGTGRNHSRPLYYATAPYNNSRWLFGADTEVIYQHDLQSRQQLDARISVNVNNHWGGKLVVSVSTDAKSWMPVASIRKACPLEVAIPKKFFPAQKIFVKLSSEKATKIQTGKSTTGSFQVNQYTYTASLTGEPVGITGSTAYIEVANQQPELDIRLVSVSECIPGGQNFIRAFLKNKGTAPVTVAPKAIAVRIPENDRFKPFEISGKEFTLAPGEEKDARLPFDVRDTGTWRIKVLLTQNASVSFTATVPHYLDASYGKLLAEIRGKADIWTASSGWKIHPTRPVPENHDEKGFFSGIMSLFSEKKIEPVRLAMAANEAEAVQLVITPKKDLRGVTVTSSELVSSDGKKIPAEQVEVLKVYYHDVLVKTDPSGVVGLWPDALPPQSSPADLKKQINHPFWIRVTAVKGTPAGIYRGYLTVSDQKGWKQQIELQVKVFNFTLPDTMTCKTAFGLYHDMIWKYHKPQNRKQSEKILHKYLKTMSEHHLSPYLPSPFARFTFKLKGWKKQQLQWAGRNVRLDRTEKFKGTTSLHLKDDSTTKETIASCRTHFEVADRKNITVSFAYKTDPSNTSLFTVLYKNKDEVWIRGKNQDIKLPGTGRWEQKTVRLRSIPEGAAFMDIALRAAKWTGDGRLTGETWFDEISILKEGEKEPFFTDDFEPPVKDLNKLDIVIDWSKWDEAMHMAFDYYHFNSRRLYVEGLGGGTFRFRRQPVFMGFTENTPEYRILHRKFLKKIQDHLEEKGWLDKIIVYEFDEPDPKDYEFVMNSFRKLKEGAPKLNRLITEEVVDGLIGGPNIWCPLPSTIDLKTIGPRQAAGEEFWWYVCTGPKAPYVTLFIDHPGTEMRVWLWQSWKYGIKGILSWQTTNWDSPVAYPEPGKPQNPYLDPMSWIPGKYLPKGSRHPWGNGDGRFLYPPLSAADGRSDKPVFDDPVDSIRIEMLRDGIEDYEYFVILERLIRENRRKLDEKQLKAYRELLKVPEEVTRSLTDFTLTPQPMEEHRMKMAEAIEELK